MVPPLLSVGMLCLLGPVVGEDLLDLRMQAQMHGAGVHSVDERGLLAVGVLARRHVEGHFQTADTAGVGIHDLVDLHRGAGDVQTVVAGVDAHDGQGAGAQRGGAEVRGGEGFALALVVQRGIGDDGGAGGGSFCEPV